MSLHRYYFAKKFEHIIEAAAAKSAIPHAERPAVTWPRRLATLLRVAPHLSTVPESGLDDNDEHELEREHERKAKHSPLRKLRPDMIRRMDDAPKLVNPSGWISGAVPTKRFSAPQIFTDSRRLSFANAANEFRSPPRMWKSPTLRDPVGSAPSA